MIAFQFAWPSSVIIWNSFGCRSVFCHRKNSRVFTDASPRNALPSRVPQSYPALDIEPSETQTECIMKNESF